MINHKVPRPSAQPASPADPRSNTDFLLTQIAARHLVDGQFLFNYFSKNKVTNRSQAGTNL